MAPRPPTAPGSRPRHHPAQAHGVDARHDVCHFRCGARSFQLACAFGAHPSHPCCPHQHPRVFCGADHPTGWISPGVRRTRYSPRPTSAGCRSIRDGLVPAGSGTRRVAAPASASARIQRPGDPSPLLAGSPPAVRRSPTRHVGVAGTVHTRKPCRGGPGIA